MTQHFTRGTISATFHCPKCGKPTPHRIDDGRKGPCLTCIERLEVEYLARKAEQDRQGVLFA